MATWMIPDTFSGRSASSVRRGEDYTRRHHARVAAELTPAKAKSKEDEGDGWRLESIFASSLRRQMSEETKAGAKHLSCRTAYTKGTSSGSTERRQGLAPDARTLGGVQQDPVVQAFPEACDEGLCGFVETAKDPIVKIERRHVTGQLKALVCARSSGTEHRPLGCSFACDFSVRTSRSFCSSSTSRCIWPVLVPLVGLLAGSKTCRSG